MENAATIYELVRFRDGDRVRLVYLAITNCRGAWVRGYEVSATGDEIVPVGADRRLRIIHKGVVISRRPCLMDRHYGELVPGKPMLG